MKQRLLDLMVHPALEPVHGVLRRGIGTVWMLHRFERSATDDEMISVPALRANLQYLRDNGYNLVSLLSLVETLRAGGSPPARSVVFTVDDGYSDFKDVGLPVFAEFDCPVTLFVATGAIDHTLWFWWDQAEYLFLNARVRSVECRIGDAVHRYEWQSPAGAITATIDFCERLKTVPNSERLAALDRLGVQLDVALPAAPPDAYALMNWDDVRSLRASGLVDVAPHTVTHPILSRLTQPAMEFEIRESLRRLREEYPEAVPLFCYPNGGKRDYTPGVVAELQRSGFLAAVCTDRDYARKVTSTEALYRIPRFDCPNDVPHFAQVVSGVERVKQMVRRGNDP
jgi:peptidoglycan/xylan/chitin deacetylase (PgdA/CDA1 family)